MSKYSELSPQQKAEEFKKVKSQYEEYKSRGLKLDMSRGKPASEQYSISEGLLKDGVGYDFFDAAGNDTRNYGELCGIAEMRGIFGAMLGVDPQNVICGGNSSLNLMYDTVSRAYTHGLPHSEKPWGKYEKIKFLCPSPGYDRHFAVTQHFGAELVLVPITDNGPDMDVVEKLVASDDTVKGIWCVPVFSNPTGCVYSDETIHRLATMKCAAPDFTIMWDNAYGVHSLYGEPPVISNILEECKKSGNPERVIEFASTSKITFSGAGVSCVAGSDETVAAIKKSLTIQTIGYDKVNQLLHARFIKNIDGIHEIMRRQAGYIRPKFEMVESELASNLGGLEIARWTDPKGGYFISLNVLDSSAKRVVELCKEAGVKLTPAGASFPYGVDPDDTNIRIAPTYPTLDELKTACELLCIAAKLAWLEKHCAVD